MCEVWLGLIEIIAGIQIVLAADLKPNLFVPGSDFQDFTMDFPWSIFPTFRPLALRFGLDLGLIFHLIPILILRDLSASSFASVFPGNGDEMKYGIGVAIMKICIPLGVHQPEAGAGQRRWGGNKGT